MDRPPEPKSTHVSLWNLMVKFSYKPFYLLIYLFVCLFFRYLQRNISRNNLQKDHSPSDSFIF